jgi:hypothetical protein
VKIPKWIKDPRRSLRFHAGAALFFFAQIPFAQFTPLKFSIAYLVFLSQWALVGQHWGAAQGAQAAKEAKENS